MLIRIEFNSLYLGSEFFRIAPILGLSTPNRLLLHCHSQSLRLLTSLQAVSLGIQSNVA